MHRLYFYEYIKSYLEEEKERKLKQEKLKLDVQNLYEPILSFYNEKVNNCKYKTWKMRYWMDNRFNYSCEIVLFDYSYASSFKKVYTKTRLADFTYANFSLQKYLHAVAGIDANLQARPQEPPEM